MAVERKAGKPVADPVAPLPGGYGTADFLADIGAVTAAEIDAAAAEFLRAAAASRPVPRPDAGPRGVSVLRGAFGPWLAAQELRRLAGGRP